MNAHGINVFNKADGNHVVFRIPDYLQLQFFPAQHRFLYQHLSYQAGLQTAGAYRFQLFFIVYQPAAGTAHGVGRTKHYRVAQTISNFQCFFHAVCHFAAGHFDAQLSHRVFKSDTVFTPFDGIYLHTDHFDIVFVQNTGFIQLCAQVQTGLAAQVGQQSVRAFLGDDLFQPFHV